MRLAHVTLTVSSDKSQLTQLEVSIFCRTALGSVYHVVDIVPNASDCHMIEAVYLYDEVIWTTVVSVVLKLELERVHTITIHERT